MVSGVLPQLKQNRKNVNIYKEWIFQWAHKKHITASKTNVDASEKVIMLVAAAQT